MKKYAHIFEADLLRDLKGKTIHGGIYSLGSLGAVQILQFGSIIILARILLPEHFGLVSMVTALTGFAERFKHLGLSTATIQQKEITHEQVSMLFWINASVGVLITLVIAGLSQAVASFYGETKLIAVTMALSLPILFGALSIQHEALLRRQMRFKALAGVQFAATLFSVVLAIVLAFEEFTYWALVWKEVARAALDVVGKWIACRWWPSFVGFSSGVGSLLRVGRNILSADTIYSASRSLDQLLLGKLAGAEALGFYRQAFQLMAVPMSQLSSPVGSVALPSLSALQDQPDRYRAYYKKLLNLLSFVTIPLTVYIAIFSEDIILVVLGSKWLDAAWILRILALGAVIEPLFSTCGMVMITQRNTKRLLLWTVMYATCLILGFGVGIHWGAIGVAAGYTVAHYVLMIPSLWLSFKDTPLSLKLFFESIAVPAFFSSIMGIALLILANETSSLQSISRLAVALFIAGIVYGGLWLILPRVRDRLFSDVTSILSALKPASSRGN